MMRLALLLPLLAYATDDHYATEDDHIKPAEFMSRWGTDTATLETET